MDYQYSPFNPVIWGIFIGSAALIYGVVRAFQARHPDYPGERAGQELPEKTQQKKEGIIQSHTSATAFAGAGGTDERRNS